LHEELFANIRLLTRAVQKNSDYKRTFEALCQAGICDTLSMIHALCPHG
jgi:hypothetical protein